MHSARASQATLDRLDLRLSLRHRDGAVVWASSEGHFYMSRCPRAGGAAARAGAGDRLRSSRLAKLAAAARRLGYRLVQIQTNGRLLCHADYLDRLVDAGVDYSVASVCPTTWAAYQQLFGHGELRPL